MSQFEFCREADRMLTMPFWYFFTIPKLPPNASHPSNQVEVQKYLCAEGDFIEPGAPLAIIENYWAVMRLKANGRGVVTKTFFARPTYVKVGDPIAIVAADGDEIPYGKDYVSLEIVKMKHEKPQKHAAAN
jgi:pyruvate/2-oxoglutarate dehydrogenase complex dihydrolipoamide acyltransferase (E2) component